MHVEIFKGKESSHSKNNAVRFQNEHLKSFKMSDSQNKRT